MDDNQRCALKFDKIITVIKSLITMKYCSNINFSNAAIVHCLDNYTLLNPVVFYEKYLSKYLNSRCLHMADNDKILYEYFESDLNLLPSGSRK